MIPRNVKFQFTPLREGQPERYKALNLVNGQFQFTPLREGQLESQQYSESILGISIHAPA